jgi:intraflagellar transport protein 52
MVDKENFGAGLILFNVSKRELGTPGQNYKKLAGRLQAKYKIEINEQPLDFEILAEASLLVLAGP